MASRARRPEPGAVAIHNASGEHLQQVVLKAARVKPGQPVRLGSVSPVPMGTTQQFGRRTDPPPFPLWVEVGWMNALGQVYSAEISLAEVLKRATGAPGETLVFVIHVRGRLEAMIIIAD